MAGRKPHLSLLVTENNHLTNAEKKARESGEPKGCTAKLEPPDELSKEARKEWNRVVRLYKQLDAEIINDLDISVFALYCENVAIMKRAQEKLKNEDVVVGDESPHANPLIKVIQDAGSIIMRTSELLCLSPVGRARRGMMAQKAETKSDLQKFIEKRRASN